MDPASFAGTRILGGWFGVYDFDLLHGRVVHDYLADEALWPAARAAGDGRARTAA